MTLPGEDLWFVSLCVASFGQHRVIDNWLIGFDKKWFWLEGLYSLIMLQVVMSFYYFVCDIEKPCCVIFNNLVFCCIKSWKCLSPNYIPHGLLFDWIHMRLNIFLFWLHRFYILGVNFMFVDYRHEHQDWSVSKIWHAPVIEPKLIDYLLMLWALLVVWFGRPCAEIKKPTHKIQICNEKGQISERLVTN